VNSGIRLNSASYALANLRDKFRIISRQLTTYILQSIYDAPRYIIDPRVRGKLVLLTLNKQDLLFLLQLLNDRDGNLQRLSDQVGGSQC